MIGADLVLETGLLKSCRIKGHAGAGPKGSDIVCAAVSVLARTAFYVLSEKDGITVCGDFSGPGEFWLEISAVNPENIGFLAGAGAFLEEGILSVSREFPDFCTINIDRRK